MKHKYTEEQIEGLKQFYPQGNWEEIEKLFPNVSHSAICSLANNRGIKSEKHPYEDKTGKRYGKLVVVKYYGRNENNRVCWVCKCECGKEVIIASNNLKKHGGISSCGCDRGSKRQTPFRYTVGEVVQVKSGQIKIVKQSRVAQKNKDRVQHVKEYEYICLECGYQGKIREIALNNKQGCSACKGRACVRGINDLWTTEPHVAELLWDKADGYLYRKRSAKKVNWRCPTCGMKIENIPIAQITVERHVSCPVCANSISYPNKFMFLLLQELGIDFIREFCPKWDGQKKYDFCIGNKIIIEMDGGLGHGHKQWGKNGAITPQESLRRDEEKDRIAIQNGYEVIRIDCAYARDNRYELVKNNILNSRLATLYNLDAINFDEIDQKCWESDVERVCKMYTTTRLSVKEIASKFGLYHETVIKYLKRGEQIGLCAFSEDKGRLPQTYYQKKQVSWGQYDARGELVRIYDGFTEVEKVFPGNKSNIYKAKNKSMKMAQGFYWRTANSVAELPISIDVPVVAVNQYDLTGRYIKTYSSIAEAENSNPEIGILVQKTASFRIKSIAGGYRWKVDNGNHDDLEKTVRTKARKVAQIDMATEKTIHVYNSLAEAKKTTGIQNISNACSGKYKQAGGYIWKYV